MKKRAIAMLLTVCMASSMILGGCGSANKNGNTESNTSSSEVKATDSGEKDAASDIDTSEHVKINGYVLGAPEANFDKVMAEVNKMLTEDINAEMEVTFIDWGVLDSKYPLLLAAGENIDWIYTADWCKYKAEAEKNAFLKIDMDMVQKYMPLSYKSVPEVAWKQLKINDSICMLPKPTPDIKAGAWLIRQDLADKYGVDTSKINGVWDMDDYFAAIKKNEPSMIPLNMDNSYDLYTPIWALTTALGGRVVDKNKAGVVKLTDDAKYDDGFYSIFDEPVYSNLKKAAEKMKEWYDKGYINQDVLAATTKSSDNFQQGISAVANDNTLNMQSILAKSSEMGWDTKIVLTNDAQGHQKKNAYLNNGVALAATTKNPERTMMALDLIMNDPRYTNLIHYGIEGENYILTADGKVDYPEGVTADTTTYNWDNTGFWFLNDDTLKARATWSDEYIKLNKETLDSVLIDDPVPADDFATDNVKTQLANVQSVWVQYFSPIAVGNVKDVDKAFEELKTQLKAAGYDELVAEAKANYGK